METPARCADCAYMIDAAAHSNESAQAAHDLFNGDHAPNWWTMGMSPEPAILRQEAMA